MTLVNDFSSENDSLVKIFHRTPFVHTLGMERRQYSIKKATRNKHAATLIPHLLLHCYQLLVFQLGKSTL